MCIPFGGGILINLDNIVNVRAEFIYRETTTDYLDDVHEARTNTALFDKNLPQDQAELAHQLYIRRGEIDPKSNKQTGPRGNPSNDGYYTFNVKLGIRLMGQRKKRVS
ncbi:MAG: outer rane beta-barrel protein [Chitinophagaceae bacterium]|nr:outer rane beta-barrel protein [Chitinophagaceae bacterium]